MTGEEKAFREGVKATREAVVKAIGNYMASDARKGYDGDRETDGAGDCLDLVRRLRVRRGSR